MQHCLRCNSSVCATRWTADRKSYATESLIRENGASSAAQDHPRGPISAGQRGAPGRRSGLRASPKDAAEPVPARATHALRRLVRRRAQTRKRRELRGRGGRNQDDGRGVAEEEDPSALQCLGRRHENSNPTVARDLPDDAAARKRAEPRAEAGRYCGRRGDARRGL